MLTISSILENYQNYLDKEICICGWVLTTRSQKELMFIKINDGTCPDGIQIIYEDTTNKYSIGSSLEIIGKLIKSPAAGQLVEVQATNVNIIGNCDESYPLSKTKMNLDYLRNFLHLRTRTSTFGSISRIKSSISVATTLFFESKKYLHLDPNILTVNECEGGAGVFQVTENDITDLSKLKKKKDTNLYDWTLDHFEKPTYLTVSSQLQLEALACSLGSVYTTNKSFRSEHSLTNKHLSEFTHLEIESCFITLDDLMNIGEEYIKFIGKYLLEKCNADIENLGKFISVGLKEKIQTIIDTPYIRIKYKEAIEIAQKLGKTIQYGEDLSSEVENCLTEHFKAPVFVSHWPIKIKSFYMKQDEENPEICHNFDLLMPYKVGELIGGSMREDNYEKLISMMKVKGVSPEPLKFYTDLRKYGSVPHGGFGLGFDRITMLMTGMENIKDTVPFPVYFRHCNY
jgi:asparaginyl-tRNA synthetase